MRWEGYIRAYLKAIYLYFKDYAGLYKSPIKDTGFIECIRFEWAKNTS